MTQTWNPQDYAQNAAFVHGLAGGVLEWLDAKPDESILDLGCGDGQLTQRIAATGARVAGVDASPEMLAAARSRGIEPMKATPSRCPSRIGRFDAVFSNAVLHWVRDQDAMMAEVRRVLKPGGRFVAEMGGHGNIAAIRVAFMAVLARHGYRDREEGVNYYPTPRGLLAQARAPRLPGGAHRADSAPHSTARERHDRLAAHLSPRRARRPAGGDSRDRRRRDSRAACAGSARR